jgi:esterase
MKLFYRKYGSGPTLIILHGLFGSSDNWASIAKSLYDKFTIILPDLRNHGQSPHSQVHDYNSMTDDLHELVNELKPGKFFLAGHSMGGKTAVNFAMKWPELLYGLLIADISPLVRAESNTEEFNRHIEILNFMLNTDLSGFRSRSEVESLLKQQIKSERIQDLILKNLKREQDNSFTWKINASAIHNNLNRIMEGISAGEADKVITGFPVYFLRGENSHYLPEKDIPGILEVFPGAGFITIPGAGHWIHADNPGMVTKCFRQLLENY